MNDSRAEILRYLESTKALYTSYTHHKETMAWGAVLLYAALASSLISFLGTPIANIRDTKIVFTILFILIFTITNLYVYAQFKLRTVGADYEATCGVLAAEIISNDPNANLQPNDYALDTNPKGNSQSDYALPKLIKDRAKLIGKQGTFERRKLQAYAYFFILLPAPLVLLKIWDP